MTDPNAKENNPFIELGEIPAKKYTSYNIQNIHIPMRDGIKIAATVCLPDGINSEKIPTVLTQTRYWRAMELRIPFRWILDEVTPNMPNTDIITSRGYAFIITDVRGTGASYGDRIVPFSEEEIRDGHDIVEWIISQPWSDGNVVSKGISYTGTTAELFPINNHPSIKAVIPGHGFWDTYTDVAYPGGVYDNGFMQSWSFLGKNLDLNNPKVFRQVLPGAWLFTKGVKPIDDDIDLKLLKEVKEIHKNNQYVYDHTFDKEGYRDEKLPDGTAIDDISIFSRKSGIEKSNVPMLIWCSWYDSGYGDGAIHKFMNLSNPMITILGDWNHGAGYPSNQFHLDRESVTPSPRDKISAWMNFFDKCIFGDGIEGKVLYYYTMVEEKWKKTDKWPPKNQSFLRMYLKEENSLGLKKPETDDGEDIYKVNFRTTTGRLNRWWTLLASPVVYENKYDKHMLCYSSDPMKDDVEITGQAIINLFISSTHDDGVIFVYLKDVDEDGHVTYITDGEFRVIHRKVSTEKPPYKILVPYHTYLSNDASPLIPGEIAEVKFGLHNTSVLIKKGHRLKVAIAGCDKDTFYKYPREGRPEITISRNKNFASYIDLPIIRNNEEVN